MKRMRTKNGILNRVMALFFVMVMILSLIPAPSFAAGGDYTITVKSNGSAVSGAKVSYIVTVDGERSQGETSTDSNGIATLPDMASHQEALDDGKTITLQYTVSKSGYETASGTVTVKDTAGNTDVSLTRKTVTVSASKSGNGTVKLNGETTGSVQVNEGDSVRIEATPSNGAVIKSVTIDGTVQTIADNKSFTKTVNPSANMSVSVVFVNQYTVTARAGSNGSITLNGKAQSSLTVDENASVSVGVKPNAGYQIASVTINGTAQSISDANSFSKNITVSSNTTVEAEFIQVFKVTVSYDAAKGTVTTNPALSGGSVTIQKGKTLSLNAVPAANYRVSAVTINGSSVSVSGDNGSGYTNNSLKPDRDTTVTITFSPNRYTVSTQRTTHGTIEASNKTVDHGGSATILVNPERGYYINRITVNGSEPDPSDVSLDDDGNIIISNITRSITVGAEFVVEETLGEDTYTFSKNGLVRQKDEATYSVYVYQKNSSVVFSATGNNLNNRFKINGSPLKNYTTVTNSVLANELKIQRRIAYGDRWTSAKLPHNRMALIIDNTAPKGTTGDFKVIQPDDANQYGYYNSSVNVAVNAFDPDDAVASNTYSGIQSVYYWVTCDGNVTQGKEYKKGESSSLDLTDKTEAEKDTIRRENGILYEYEPVIKNDEGEEIEQEPQQEVHKSFTVNVNESMNNSDNVVVHAVIVDLAGNEREETLQLKINATKPKVKIEMGGAQKAGAEQGYYALDKRTATITIVDRESCFDGTLGNAGLRVKRNGEDITSQIAKQVSWQKIYDNTLQGIVEFPSAGEYEWSYYYVNKADLRNDGYTDTTVKPDTFKFVVDADAPEGKIKVESDSWAANALERITFGIWKDHAVTVTVEGAKDAQSPLKDILYYKTKSQSVLTGTELEELYKQGKFVEEEYTISADEAFVVYARVTDYAGNALYLGTNGVVVDMTKSRIDLEWDQPNAHGFYNKNFNVYATVNELESDSSKDFSGIRSIDYKVMAEVEAGKEQVTQEGNLYKFNEKNPTLSQLKKSWAKEQSIEVDAQKNNYNRVWVVVSAEDNAGNTVSKSTEVFSVNVNPPEALLTYDDNKPNKTDEDGRSYFGKPRTATYTILDRESSFDETVAEEGISIQATDSQGKEVTLDKDAMIGEWSHDGDRHSVQIVFSQDGNYTVAFSYQNKADSRLQPVDTGDSVSPFVFTVDTTDPEGKVLVDNQILKKIANVLSFGLLFKNTGVKIGAEATDKTSPVTIEYYKTDSMITPTRGYLDQQKFSPYKGEMEIKANEQLVIYFKISDYAGNYIYLNSEGYVLDEVPCDAEMVPEKPNKNGVYNDDVNVDVHVTDRAPYSGIKTVSFWVENNGTVSQQEEVLYTYDVEEPTQKQLVNDWKGSFTVDAGANNGSNIVAYVKTVDNAGNESTTSIPLDIDITAPAIKVSYAETANPSALEGYYTSRTATIVITERNNHFNAQKATAGIKITATDGKGVSLSNTYEISDWKTTVNDTDPDATTHTATVKYKKNANYTFEISYTDEADNENSGVDTSGYAAPFKFAVDTVAPTGTVTARSEEGRQETWNSLAEDIYFGFWSRSKITLSRTAQDVTSPIQSVKIYMPSTAKGEDPGKLMTKEQLDQVTTWEDFNGLDITTDNQFTAYLQIMDDAGNYTYMSTNGLQVDRTHPDVESVAPVVTTNPTQPINGIYKGDVKVSVKVEDPTQGGSYSGLKTIRYKVFDRASAQPDTPTQEGTLYSFDTSNPKQKDLKKSWSGEITIDSKKNNSNNIQIVVYAEDNAGNGTDNSQSTSKSYRVIKIDTTAPTIDISFNNNSVDSGKYFKAARTATIKITERNFNAADVKVNIKNSNGRAPVISDWKTTKGSYNQDNTTHVATVSFVSDGDYTFNVGYTDLAGNPAQPVRYANGSVATGSFTIDRTIPTISVSYDNNSAQNGNYYKAPRTATVTIREHNFSTDRVKISIGATDDGRAIAAPAIRGWSHSGDNHTATISYTADGMYTFDISYTDLAGNPAAAFSRQTFYVDKTTPKLEITGVENESANNGEVKPVVTCSDTNLDFSKISIKLSGAEQGEIEKLDGAFSDIHNGRVFTFNNFPERKSADDIYTLTATLTDKAGNTVTQTITFSVNRFGSTYRMSDATDQINGEYVKKPQDIVISEINPNELHNIRVTLFKNDKTITLREGQDYTVRVIGGEGKWYEYVYKIFADNFAKDGVYRVVLHSEDAAGNISENTLDTKTSDLEFGVDSKKPTLVLLNLEDDKTYATELYTVQGSVDDNLQLDELKVILDGEEYALWRGDDLEEVVENGGNFTFDVAGDSTMAHYVTAVASDAAGNEIERQVNKFYVTTNLWVRFFTNEVLFYGTLGLLGALALFILFLWKRRKDEEEEDEVA